MFIELIYLFIYIYIYLYIYQYISMFIELIKGVHTSDQCFHQDISKCLQILVLSSIWSFLLLLDVTVFLQHFRPDAQ